MNADFRTFAHAIHFARSIPRTIFMTLAPYYLSGLQLMVTCSESSGIHCCIAVCLFFFICLRIPNHAQKLSCICVCLLSASSSRPITMRLWAPKERPICPIDYLCCVCLDPFHLPPTILCPAVGSETPCWSTSACFLTF